MVCDPDDIPYYQFRQDYQELTAELKRREQALTDFKEACGLISQSKYLPSSLDNKRIHFGYPAKLDTSRKLFNHDELLIASREYWDLFARARRMEHAIATLKPGGSVKQISVLVDRVNRTVRLVSPDPPMEDVFDDKGRFLGFSRPDNQRIYRVVNGAMVAVKRKRPPKCPIPQPFPIG